MGITRTKSGRLRKPGVVPLGSDEFKRKISLALKGVPSPLKGVPRSLKTRRKMSKARKGIRLSDSHKKAISQGNSGKVRTAYTADKFQDVILLLTTAT
jgi:NUMOD3 motif